LLEGLEFNKWKETIKPDSTVFLKPNFTHNVYTKGVTTNPLVLRSLLEILTKRCSRVIVGESDGGDNSFRAESAFEGHGMNEMCKELGVELVNLCKMPAKPVESVIQGRKVRVPLPKLLIDEVDCFISVPVLKVHVVTQATLGMKNLWGCYPDTMRGLHHKNLDYKLVLMAKMLNPKFVIIDGTYSLNMHGPMFGQAVKSDLLVVSNNIVVSDSLGIRLMGLKLKSVKHVMLAEKEGLGTTDLSKIQLNKDWQQYEMHFQVNKTLLDRASIMLFYSDTLAKLVGDSLFSKIIYGVATKFRNPEEKMLAAQSNDENGDTKYV
jgi:uncharacterized protein (DUF362 family)